MPGLGTVLNVVAILVGSSLGVLIGNRLPERVRLTVTDALGLTTLVIGGLNLVAITSGAFKEAGGSPVLIVLGALLIGGILGAALRVEERLEGLGGWLQRRFSRRSTPLAVVPVDGRARFIEGFVDASLLFCIGPLALLGSLSDGLGRGIDQLALKSVLDLFASLAFAATLGWGVAASALSVGVVQGLFTAIAYFAGASLAPALIDSMTATGGVLLLGVGLRLLNIRQIPVGNLLPALIIAPLLTLLVERLTL